MSTYVYPDISILIWVVYIIIYTWKSYTEQMIFLNHPNGIFRYELSMDKKLITLVKIRIITNSSFYSFKFRLGNLN